MPSTSDRFTLRQLPLPAKLVASVFLCSVGLGYFSALIQLHFKQADPGSFMPTPKNVIRSYHGELPEMQLKAVIDTPEDAPWSSTSMRKAFTSKAEDWREAIKERDEQLVRKEREGERLVMIAWLMDEKNRRTAYENDLMPIPPKVEALTAEFKTDQGAKIKSIINTRCAICHGPDGEKSDVLLNDYEHITKYTTVVPAGRLSTDRLAQSTHAHLLSFSMLFALTGMVFAFSSYPMWFRCLLGPFVLLMQIIDISFWWLARLDGSIGEMFALGIMLTGGLVGMGLFFQITLSLFNMYGAKGKTVLWGIFIAGIVGVGVGKTVFFDQYLEEEKKAVSVEKP